MRPSPSSTLMRPSASLATSPVFGRAPSAPIPAQFKSDGPTSSRNKCHGEGWPFRGRHHVHGQPRPVPDRRMLKPCMRPHIPCRVRLPSFPATYGQGLARPARPQRPPVTFPLGGGYENQGPVTKNREFVTGARDRFHVTGRVTRNLKTDQIRAINKP